MWTRPCFTRTGAGTLSPKHSMPSVCCSAFSAPTRVSRSSSSYSSTLLWHPRWARFGRKSLAGYICLIGQDLPVTTFEGRPRPILPTRAVPVVLSHLFRVMAGLVPAIYVFPVEGAQERRGCPRQSPDQVRGRA